MSDTPFDGGFLGDLVKMLGQQGPDAWVTTATQLAVTIARGDDGDPNPAPTVRTRLEALAPLVARHVGATLSIHVDHDVEAVTRTALTLSALEQWQPLVAPLVTATPVVDDPTGGALAQLAGAMGPLMAGFQLGSVAGHYSERAWGLDLALPRHDETHRICVNNVDAFATEWSLDPQAVDTYAVAREFAAAAILSRPGTGDALRALLLDTVTETARVQGTLFDKMRELGAGGDPSALMANPERLLEGIVPAVESHATRSLNAACATLTAAFDAIALDVVTTLFGPQSSLAEARRRYRLSDARGEDAAGALMGISTQGDHVVAATEFVAAIAQQHGLAACDAFMRVDGLVTADELNAPDDWWRRVSTSPLA